MRTNARQRSAAKTKSTTRFVRKSGSTMVDGGMRNETSTGVKAAVNARARTVTTSHACMRLETRGSMMYQGLDRSRRR